MDRGAKIAAAVGILLAGTAIALLFRRELHAPPPPPAVPAMEQLVVHGQGDPLPERAVPVLPQAAPIEPASPAEATRAAAADEGLQPIVAANVALPTIPSGPVQASTPALTTALPAVAAQSPAEMPGKPALRHKIVDGDTLAELAQRYLGGADRASEIFAANRTVLPNPDLLPIGAELTIPPRDAPRPAPMLPAPVKPAPPAATPLRRPLVPVTPPRA